jgi:5-dehydro-2-deoxygluconokinase
VIVGNDVEFGFMAGDYDKGLDKARELAGQSAAITVYKMGEKGAITFADGEEVRTGIYPVDALKPEGAGDSFMAGFMASLAGGHALKEAILRGSACASVTVSKPAARQLCQPPLISTPFCTSTPAQQKHKTRPNGRKETSCIFLPMTTRTSPSSMWKMPSFR